MADHLFVDLQHGLANRLRVLASAQALAVQAGCPLTVIWCPDHHCEAQIHDLIAWDGPVIACRATADRVAAGAALCVSTLERPDLEIAPAGVAGALYVTASDVLAHEGRSLAAEQHVLRALVPVAAVCDLVARVPTPSGVAAHIRMSTGPAFDHLPHEAPSNWSPEMHAALTRHRAASDVSRFIARLDTLMERAESVFVAADLPETYATLAARYGPRLRMLERDLYDRSPRQLQYALADLILLSAAPHFLASTWSSFSDVAQRLAAPGRRVEQSGRDF